MTLSSLLDKIPSLSVSGSTDIPITGISYDSRKISVGNAFVCIQGEKADGHDYISAAYKAGARVFFTCKKTVIPDRCTEVRVSDCKMTLALLSAEFFGHPEKKLKIIGITGTKGKSTVAYMIFSVLNNNTPTGFIGSMGVIFGDTHTETSNTTPESRDLYEYMSQMAEHGIKTLVLEVSSQAIAQKRVYGIGFDTAVFTNLSKDHIGAYEHKSFEDYALAKREIFKGSRLAVLNADDKYFPFFAQVCDRYISYGTEAGDVRASGIVPVRGSDFFGCEFDAVHDGITAHMKLRSPGRRSVCNALAAYCVCSEYGVTAEAFSSCVSGISVPGRFECVDTVLRDRTFIIDYAHNGDSLACTLSSLREYSPDRIICVFGSVGERTLIRRKELADASSRYADFSVITSDNPGSEQPEKIAREIAENMTGEFIVIPERDKAIKYAVDYSRPGDIVVFAGKGNEKYQLTFGKKIPFSEKQLISEYASACKQLMI